MVCWRTRTSPPGDIRRHEGSVQSSTSIPGALLGCTPYRELALGQVPCKGFRCLGSSESHRNSEAESVVRSVRMKTLKRTEANNSALVTPPRAELGRDCRPCEGRCCPCPPLPSCF